MKIHEDNSNPCGIVFQIARKLRDPNGKSIQGPIGCGLHRWTPKQGENRAAGLMLSPDFD